MVRLVSCLLLLLVGLGVNAQTVWNNTYVADRPVMLFGSVVATDTAYIVSGATYGTNQISKSMLGAVNLSGNLARYNLTDDTSLSYYYSFSNTLLVNHNGDIVGAGRLDDTTSNLFMSISNTDFDSISVNKYYTPNTYAYDAYDLIEVEGSYYIAGLRTNRLTNNADIALVKIDSAGNRLWERFYNQKKYDYAVSIIQLYNGNLMLGGFRDDINNTNERANTWLLEVDTAGQVVRQWFDPNDSTYAAEGLLQTADGGFIYGAQKKFTQSITTVSKTATIVRLRDNLTKLWVFEGGVEGDFTGINDIELINDTTYIACGNYSNGQGWVIKFTDSGIIQWEKKYKGLQPSGTWNILKDIDVLPDGSFIAAGYCQWIVNPNSNPPQVGWLLKLDADGCEIENCLLGLGPQTPEGGLNSQIQVWPNPFSSDISIALTGSHVSTATFIITNTTGQVVYQQQETNLAAGYTKMLDLSYLPNGVYFVEVSTAAGKAVQRLVKE